MSEGVGDQRHITVMKTKPVEIETKEEPVVAEQFNEQFRSFSLLEEQETIKPGKKKKSKTTNKTQEESVTSTETTEEKASNSVVTPPPVLEPVNLCRYCHKDIPQQNFQLHEIYCQRMHPVASVSTTNESSVEAKPSTKLNIASERPKTVKKKQDKISAMSDDASFDELLEAARQQDNICQAQRCKAKITLLGQLCSYCNRRYCLEHSMPEVHGCGYQARKDIRQTHIATHSNLKPVYENSSISKDKRPYLERKLQDKIASKETQRKRKEK